MECEFCQRELDAHQAYCTPMPLPRAQRPGLDAFTKALTPSESLAPERKYFTTCRRCIPLAMEAARRAR